MFKNIEIKSKKSYNTTKRNDNMERIYIDIDKDGSMIVSMSPTDQEIKIYIRRGNTLSEQTLRVNEETIKSLEELKKLYEKEDALNNELRKASPINGKHEQTNQGYIFVSEFESVLKRKRETRESIGKLRNVIKKEIINSVGNEQSHEQYEIKEDYDILEFLELLEELKCTFSIGNGQKLDPDIKNTIVGIINNLINIKEQEIKIKEQEIKKVIIKIIALVTALAAAITITTLTMNLSRLQQFIAYMITVGIISVSSKIAEEGPDGKIVSATTLKNHSEKKEQALRLYLQNQLEKRQTQEAPIKPYETRVVTPDSFKAELRKMTIQEKLQALQAMKEDLTSKQDPEQTTVQGYALVLKYKNQTNEKNE